MEINLLKQSTSESGIGYKDMDLCNKQKSENNLNGYDDTGKNLKIENKSDCSLPLNSNYILAYKDNNVTRCNCDCTYPEKNSTTNKCKNENCLFKKRYTLRAKRANSNKKVCKQSNKKKSKTRIGKSKKLKCLGSSDSVSFTCSKCNMHFSVEKLIEAHIKAGKTKTTECTCKCPICKLDFIDVNKLKEHLFAHKNDQFICSVCNLAVPNIDVKKKDLKNLNKFTCDICKTTFFHMATLKKHILAHLNGVSSKSEDVSKTLQNSSYVTSSTCHICNIKFMESKELETHLTQMHKLRSNCSKCGKSQTNGEVESICDTCGQDGSARLENVQTNAQTPDLTNSSKLREDTSRRKTSADPKYSCKDCSQKFTKLVALKIHILNVHQGINYECEKCGLMFPSQSDLEGHAMANNCTRGDSYTCNVCGKVFAKRDYLKKHQYVHTNLLFKCKHCYCVFLREESYRRHMDKMNCSKSARKIALMEFNFRKCRICQVEYETEDLLLEHFGDSHVGEQPHQCFCCDSRLPTYRDLQAHIHHHNVKKFTCHLCGKPYTSQEGFRKHRLKHKGAEFKCKYCESEFLNESRFKLHEKTCKKSPGQGYDPSTATPNKKNDKPKQSRQLHWESRIIVKHLRGEPKSGQDDPGSGPVDNSWALTFFDEPESEPSNERGWFDNYYKTEEDDIAFGLKKPDDSNSNAPDTSGSSESSETSSSEEDESLEEVEVPVDYNPKKCRLCLVTFDQECELLHHFIKAHSNEMAHKCPKCDTKSPLFAQLKEHLKVHGIGNLNIFNCDNCSKKFRSEKKMKSHNVRCKGGTNGDEKPRPGDRCKRCGKKFNTKFGYRRHKQACKLKKNKPKTSKRKETTVKNVGDDGQEVQESKREVPGTENDGPATEPASSGPAEEPKKEEAKVSHAIGPPMDSFPCRLCDKKFQYERGIVMHFKSAHPGHKPLICHVCNMHLADKLKEHLKTHGIGEEFICELCGKRFNQKFLSKIHEMWHDGVEYKCNNCKQKFLNKEKMDKHVNENKCSNRQSLMRLPCAICGKSYRSKFGLSKHHLTHTPKELRPVKNRMNCEYCGKWFENNNGLQRHRRIHTGERPFCCRFCPKAFVQEGNCRAHERIHTGESKPRRKKHADNQTETTVQLATLQQVLPQPEVVQVATVDVVADSMSFGNHISLYVYNSIDPEGAVH